MENSGISKEMSAGAPVAGNAVKAPVKKRGGEHVKATPKKSHKKGWIITGSIVGVLAVAYLGTSLYFSSHFGPNTTMGGVDISGKTVPEVQSVVADQVGGYELQLVEREDKKETIKGTDIDLQYNPGDEVQQMLDGQNSLLWAGRLVQNQDDNDLHPPVTYNEEKLQSQLDALTCTAKENQVAPVNAQPKLNLDEKKYDIQPESVGTTLDMDVFPGKIAEAVSNTADSINLDEMGCYVNPIYTSKSQEIIDLVDQLNEYAKLSVTYKLTDGETETLDINTTRLWFGYDSTLTATLSNEKMEQWVDEFAEKHNTVGKTRQFTGGYGNACEVSGGTYGWEVDKDKELNEVKWLFVSGKNQNREPFYTQTAASSSAQDWGTTYLEVDITNQHMWLYQNGEVTFESDVVTGLPTSARRTPSGVYSILEKQRDKVLRGSRKPDGTWGYQTPVSYWMRVTWTGVGFHDASWQPYFGGSRYLSGGSHGCINMPYSKAKTLYSMIDTGIPVVVHY